MKECNKCLETKPMDSFHKESKSGDGRRGDCKECRAAISKTYHDKNKERKNIESREYRVNNREMLNRKEKERRHSDPVFNEKKILRGRLSTAIRRNGSCEKPLTTKMLECSWSYFKFHMESKFSEGMTWANYGEWQVDHIKPLAIARSIDTVRAFFKYTNLQPLWTKDNIKKGIKIC